MQLPPMYLFWISFAVVLGLGSLLSANRYLESYIFPIFFLLGAALPVIAVIAWCAPKMGWPITWRQALLAAIGGSTLSILIAIVLEVAISSFLLVPVSAVLSEIFAPVGGAFFVENILSPTLIIFLVGVALQAPIPEELAKVVPLRLFGRQRLNEPQKAFLVGLCAGAGFAILENMLYEGLYAQWSGWSWGGVTLLRGVGAVLHPLCTGIVALGWYRAREEGWQAFAKAYLIAIGLHTLWNGGFDALLILTGINYYVVDSISPTVNIYGLSVGILLIIYLLGLTIVLWLLLRRLVQSMAQESAPLPAIPVSQRAVAIWGLLCLIIIVPIGLLIGPAWQELQAAIF